MRSSLSRVALLYRLLRPLFFLLDAELAHSLVAAFLWLWARVWPRPRRRALLAQKLWGLDFPTPVGLAAGMDKGQILAPAWFRLGFEPTVIDAEGQRVVRLMGLARDVVHAPAPDRASSARICSAKWYVRWRL